MDETGRFGREDKDVTRDRLRPPRTRNVLPPALALLLLVSFAAAPAAREPRGSGARFDGLAKEYLLAYYRAEPVRATGLGIHDGDGELPELSRAGIERRTADLKRWLQKLEAIPGESLAGDARFDHRILEFAIRAELLELTEVRGWRKNPLHYNGVVASGIASLSDRDFAPIEFRLESLISRAGKIPALLATARQNLEGVPPLWVELAVRDTRGTASFLRKDVPAALEAQGIGRVKPELRSRWERARERAAAEVEAFAVWLEKDLKPRARGDFRLGRDLFERKVLYEEHVRLSAGELREINEKAIRDYKEWVAREAAKLDPRKKPADVLAEIARAHPGPEQLLETARRCVDEAKKFVVERGIVTLPSGALPTIRETPAYARQGFASMDTPGPFEKRGRDAYYNITNVEPDWTEEQKEQHLSYFNYPALLGVSVHEVMPGHFVQLLYQQQIPTDVRKVFAPSSLVEGWAHYTEQMVVDEGLRSGDPTVRLAQLRRALQRQARWYAGLEMHAFGASVEQAARRYEEIASFAPFPALREVQRGTYDPTYLHYALGRMQILELREHYRRQREATGKTFSLREFHDRFLRLGLPIPLAREALLGSGASPVNSWAPGRTRASD